MRSILAFLVDIRRLAVPYFRGEDRWPGRVLLATVVLLELATVFLNVQFNEWRFLRRQERHLTALAARRSCLLGVDGECDCGFRLLD